MISQLLEEVRFLIYQLQKAGYLPAEKNDSDNSFKS
jgi:hypothetical protein